MAVPHLYWSTSCELQCCCTVWTGKLGRAITSPVTQGSHHTTYDDTASQDANPFSLEQVALRVRGTVVRSWRTECSHPKREDWKFQHFTHLSCHSDDTDSYPFFLSKTLLQLAPQEGILDGAKCCFPESNNKTTVCSSNTYWGENIYTNCHGSQFQSLWIITISAENNFTWISAFLQLRFLAIFPLSEGGQGKNR